jgi:hypothetical protein
MSKSSIVTVLVSAVVSAIVAAGTAAAVVRFMPTQEPQDRWEIKLGGPSNMFTFKIDRRTGETWKSVAGGDFESMKVVTKPALSNNAAVPASQPKGGRYGPFTVEYNGNNVHFPAGCSAEDVRLAMDRIDALSPAIQPKVPTQQEILGEAYQRGLLPTDRHAAYEEAVKRGLIAPSPATNVDPANAQVPAKSPTK